MSEVEESYFAGSAEYIAGYHQAMEHAKQYIKEFELTVFRVNGEYLRKDSVAKVLRMLNESLDGCKQDITETLEEENG